MTIGIAASGPRAGLAVFRALAAVERVGSGAIGGFVAYAALDGGGIVHRAATQRGGTGTLFVDGESTGVDIPEALAACPVAGLMSSGPDRPEPLAQFIPAEAGLGLVTGHRLPNAVGITGEPVNLAVLARLRAGETPRAAVDGVLEADPQADAGVIVATTAGAVYARNSARVAARPDLGAANRHDAASGAWVAVLHNAISPAGSLAALAADIALAVMAPPPAPAGWISISTGTPVRHADDYRVHVGVDGVAQVVETADPRILDGRHNCAAVYLGARVMRGDRVLGATLYEPNAVVDAGRIVSLSGQTTLHLPYRNIDPQGA